MLITTRVKGSLPFIERFWSRIAVGAPDQCWEYQLKLNQDGYGRICVRGSTRAVMAHRMAYYLEHGVPLDSGHEIMHTCDNRACCNPAHLTVGTHLENMQDMGAKGRSSHSQKTHCPFGHPLPAFGEKEKRYCRPCKRRRTREWDAKNPDRIAEQSKRANERRKARRRQRTMSSLVASHANPYPDSTCHRPR